MKERKKNREKKKKNKKIEKKTQKSMKKGFFKKLFATPTVIVFSTHVLVIQQLCPLFPPI